MFEPIMLKCIAYSCELCLCVLKMSAAVVKDTPIPQRLEMPSFTPPKHLDPTIYPTEMGVSSVCGREGETQMLSTAIKVTLDPQRGVKVRPSQSTALFQPVQASNLSLCFVSA